MEENKREKYRQDKDPYRENTLYLREKRKNPL